MRHPTPSRLVLRSVVRTLMGLATITLAATGLARPTAAQVRETAPDSRLEAIRLIGSGQGNSTTVLASIPSPGAVRHFMLEDPWRIVIDIDDVRHDLNRSDYPNLRAGVLLGVRTSQYGARTVRIVLDLSERLAYEVSTSGDGVRVILDGAVTEAAGAAASERRPAPTLPLVPEGPVLAVVTEIAGSTLYVDAGTRQGLFDGDTLRVMDGDDQAPVGTLTVLSSASAQALLAFAGRPFLITLGDTLHLEPSRVRRTDTAVADRENVSRAVVGAILDTDATGRGSATSAQLAAPVLPTVRGRLQLSMSARSSSTNWGAVNQTRSRSVLTPTTRLRLEASDLPGDVRLTANLRGSYRHEATGLIDPIGSLRVYELSLEKEFEGTPIRVQAGRFYSPYEAFSGYYDGALLRVGPDGFGVGAVVGLEPDRWNENFSTTRPKRSAFMDFRAVGSGRGITGEFAAVQVRPTEGAPEHLYFGWAGQTWVGRLRVSHTAQIDRDPVSGRWVISDLLVQGGLPLVGPLRVRGSWSRRSPYYFWETEAPVSYRRDDIRGGLSLDLPGGSIGGDVAMHQAEEDSSWTRSYAGSFRLHSLAGSRLGLHGSATLWDDQLLRMLNLAAGVDRSWGRGFGRLGYRMIDSRNAWFGLLSHQAEALIDVPVQPGVRATVMGLGRWGRGLRSYEIRIGFWRSF